MLQIFPALYLAIAAMWMPPSPRWLTSQGRDQEALAVLSRLRGLPEDHARVRAEWMDVIVDADFQREVLLKRHSVSQDRTQAVSFLTDIAAYLDLFKSGCWKRTFVGAALEFFQQFVGINARASSQDSDQASTSLT